MITLPTIITVPIDRAISKELQRVAKKLEALLAERNDLIIKATEDGASLREIGNLLGVNHVTVRNILQKIDQDNLVASGRPCWPTTTSSTVEPSDRRHGPMGRSRGSTGR